MEGLHDSRKVYVKPAVNTSGGTDKGYAIFNTASFARNRFETGVNVLFRSTGMLEVVAVQSHLMEIFEATVAKMTT